MEKNNFQAFVLLWRKSKTLPKAQRTQARVSALTKIVTFKSYRKLIKLKPQKLNQTSVSRPKLSFKILTKLQLKIFTKFQLQGLDQTILQNLDQAPASISWPKSRFKISASKSLRNCRQHVSQYQHQHRSIIKKFWVGIFRGHSHISQVY